jgi:MerR family mercuric resistance operon transcriptional regulator
MEDASLTIARAADAAAVGVQTIRYYERRGLIPQPTQKIGAYRRYDGKHVARIRFIKRAQELGFTLEEVESLLELEDGTNRTRVQEIASARLEQIRERIRSLTRMERTLSHLLEHCRSGTAMACPIIEALSGVRRKGDRAVIAAPR